MPLLVLSVGMCEWSPTNPPYAFVGVECWNVWMVTTKPPTVHLNNGPWSFLKNAFPLGGILLYLCLCWCWAADVWKITNKFAHQNSTLKFRTGIMSMPVLGIRSTRLSWGGIRVAIIPQILPVRYLRRFRCRQKDMRKLQDLGSCLWKEKLARSCLS